MFKTESTSKMWRRTVPKVVGGVSSRLRHTPLFCMAELARFPVTDLQEPCHPMPFRGA